MADQLTQAGLKVDDVRQIAETVLASATNRAAAIAHLAKLMLAPDELQQVIADLQRVVPLGVKPAPGAGDRAEYAARRAAQPRTEIETRLLARAMLIDGHPVNEVAAELGPLTLPLVCEEQATLARERAQAREERRAAHAAAGVRPLFPRQ